MKQKIRLTEGDLHRIIRKSIRNVLRESSDSVAVQPFGNDEDNVYVPSEEDIRRGNEFDAKWRPWVNWPDAQTPEGLISCAYHLRSDFNRGKYSYDHLICTLYEMTH